MNERSTSTASIAVIGAGSVGVSLARALTRAGRSVTFGARHPDSTSTQGRVAEAGDDVGLTTILDAVSRADVVILAVPGSQVVDAATALGSALAGKVVIDATNDQPGPPFHHLDAYAANLEVYRAFNTLGWENLDEPNYPGGTATLFFCGPDTHARTVVEAVIADVGLTPAYIGGIEQADLLDQVSRLWFTLAFGRGLGRRIALQLLI